MTVKLHGKGPKSIMEKDIGSFYKYESSSRSFKEIATKALTATTDAVTLMSASSSTSASSAPSSGVRKT